MILSLRGDLSLFILRDIYFTKFQSLIRCGTVLWGGKERECKSIVSTKKCPSFN